MRNKTPFWVRKMRVMGMMSVLFIATATLAQTPIDTGYRDFSYPSGTSGNSEVTAEKPESKLWWNDGFWWASMWSNSGNAYHIFYLDIPSQTWVDTGTELDDRSDTKADVLWDGSNLFVVSHVWTGSGSSASAGNRGEFFKYSYNSANDTYSLESGFPVEVNQAESEALVLTKDSTGQLWVTWVQDSKVMVNYSTTDHATWATPSVLPVGSDANVTSDDLSSIISFHGENGKKRIGVMWSNQSSGNTIYYATHNDNSPDDNWQSFPAYTTSGDDHLNLKSLASDDSGSLFAVVKTSKSSALVVLLVLKKASSGVLAGHWSAHNVYTSSTYSPTRPQMLIDTSNREIYVFTRNKEGTNSNIYYKSTSLDNINFPSGLGTAFIKSSSDQKINDPTTTKQNVNSTTGLVVLASDSQSKYYFHNYLVLGGIPEPDIAVTPASHDYGSINEGSSASQGFLIENLGTADLNVTATSLTGGDAAEFAITSGGGSFTLAPGGTRTVAVSFNPLSGGAKSAALSIASNDPNEDPLNVALGGTGVALAADIASTPDSLGYGDVVVNTSSSLTLQILNQGIQDLNVSATSLIGTDAADFSIDSGDGSFLVTPNGSHDIGISFHPVALGTKNATLRVSSNDPDEDPFDLSLGGNAVQQPQPDITLTPTSHDYGTIFLTQSAANTFEIRNDGNADLNVSGSTLLGIDAGEFNIDGGGGSFTLAPAGIHLIDVSFSPTSVGTKSATLRISSDDPDEDPFDVSLAGTGEEIPASSGQVTFEETQHGGSSSSSSVATATALQGAPNNLYLAAITSKPFKTATSVGGLGLTWTLLKSQCAGRNQTGMEVWMAVGNGTGGVVTASLSGTPNNAAINVTRYSGIDIFNPVGSIVSGNTNGIDGVCSGGADAAAYSFDVTTSLHGSHIYGAVAMRNKSHTPGAAYVELDEFMQGSGGSAASLAIVDRGVATLSTVTFDGSFSSSVDWAAVGVELRPGAVGDQPDIAVTPASHDFGDVVVTNTSSSQSFVVENSGTADLQVSATTLTGSHAGEFAIVGGGGSFILAPGATATIDVNSTPLSLGAKTANLSIASDDPDEDPLDVPLSGNGIAAPAPDIAVAPASNDFGDVLLNASSIQLFVVSNTGTADLHVSSSTLTGTVAAEFAIISGGGAFTLAPSQTDTVEVSFTPTNAGAKSATLRIASDDPDENPVDVALTGNGILPTPDIAVLPTSHDYGDVVINTNSSRLFEITNDGSANLNLTSKTLAGADAGQFSILSGGSAVTLAPGETDTVEVSFNPTTLGAKSATFTIASNDPDENSLDVSLSGAGVATPTPDITVAPTSHDYGAVTVSTSASQTFQLGNSGNADLMVSATSLSGVDAGNFSISAGGGSFTVAPGLTHDVDVTFTPNSVGGKSATLTITSDDPDENLLDVSLSGTGQDAPVGGDVVFEEVQTGGSANGLVSTATSLAGGVDQLYVVATTSKKFKSVASLSGLGLTWVKVIEQCSGRSQTGLSVWYAIGTTSGGQVTASFTSAPNNAAIVVSRYSGANPGTPIGNVVSGNSNGASGICDGGTDGNAYSFSVTTSSPDAVVFGASAFRNKSHAPGNGYTERAEFTQGNGGSAAGVAVMDQKFASSGATVLDGSFSSNVDWAVVGLVILGGPSTPTPDIAVAPGSHDFGSILLSSSASQGFEVSNPGSADLVVSSTSLTGTHAGEFSIDSGGGSFILTSGQTRTVSVSFNPASSGSKAAALRLVSNDPDEDPLDVALSATGVQPIPDIAASPTSYNYGDVFQDSTSSQSFVVSNSGNGDLNVSATSLAGTNAGEFNIESGGGSFVLTPGQDRTIVVSLTPVSVGSKSAVLQVASDDPDENPLDVALIGNGVQHQPDIAVTPTSGNYGDVVQDSTKIDTLVVSNAGTADLNVTTTTISGTHAGDFSVTSGGGSFTLTPNQTREVVVSFTPSALGGRTASLDFASNDPDENHLNVPLSGNGVATPTPDIAATPTSHDYGTVTVSSTSSHTFAISNTGTADLTVSTTSLVGAEAGEFNIVSGDGGFVVSAGQSHNIDVDFAPTSIGAKSASLRITSDDPDESPLDINLSGTGKDAPSGGQVVFEETASGASSNSNSLQTTGALTEIAGDLYLAAISSKSFAGAATVTGLGLAWTLVETQCSGRSQTGVEVWMAQGSPGGDGTVSAILNNVPQNAVIVVTRYSGVLAGAPVGAVSSANTNGVAGACSGGSDNNAYSFNLTTTAANSFVFGAAAMRHKTHTPGAGYAERLEVRQGTSGSVASVAVMDKEVAAASSVTVDGALSGTVDWAVIALEIKAGAGTPLAALGLLGSEKAESSDGEETMLTNAADALKQTTALPEQFSLSRNYPNPFNAETTIQYALPEAARVLLRVYNIRGQLVRTLAEGWQHAGYFRVRWYGDDNSGNFVGSGVYLVQLEAGSRRFNQRILLQK